MVSPEEVRAAFEAWYVHLEPAYKDGFPAKGTIAGGLVVLERLKSTPDFRIEAHVAPKGAQIAGAGGAAVKNILARFGETRDFVSEGGRTNRGLRGEMSDMLSALEAAGLGKLTDITRSAVLEDLQSFLVEKVREFFNRQRLRIVYDPSQTTWQAIHELLELAAREGKNRAVAHHLVGAKLTLRFPHINIRRESYTTSDLQQGEPGDYYVGDTAFHVTVAPGEAVIAKCKHNLDEGHHAYLLVPSALLDFARRLPEMTTGGQTLGRVTIESIESFVSQNVEELSTFSDDERAGSFMRLLDTYNGRIESLETDKALLVEIPLSLQRIAARMRK